MTTNGQSQRPTTKVNSSGDDIEASTVFVREIATTRKASKFRQRRIVAFTAACCYAKSAPAALHCGDPERTLTDYTPGIWAEPEIQAEQECCRAGFSPTLAQVLRSTGRCRSLMNGRLA